MRLRLKRTADDLSCAVFVLANIVTLLFYTIETLQPGGIISKTMGTPVPWINYSVHLLNSIVAWTDIVICHPRRHAFNALCRIWIAVCRFSWGAFGAMGTFGVGYGCWIYFIKTKTGSYPYGFLNKIPHPYGFFMMIPVVALLMATLFTLGKFLSSRTKHIMAPVDIEDLNASPQAQKPKQAPTDQQEVDALKLD